MNQLPVRLDKCVISCMKTSKKYNTELKQMKLDLESAAPPQLMNAVFPIIMAKTMEDRIELIMKLMKDKDIQKMIVEFMEILAKYSKSPNHVKTTEEIIGCFLSSCDKKTLKFILDVSTMANEFFNVVTSKPFKTALNVYLNAAKKQREYIIDRLGPKI